MKTLFHKLTAFLPAPVAVGGIALLATFIVLLVHESDYLWRVQELNLFLYSPLFFKQQLVVAGGLLVWLGTYFTQFFYHVWLGTLLLCAWLGLLMFLVYKTFRIPAQWSVLLLIPLALVLLTDFDLGYWIYYLKLRGHFFVTVIGTCLTVGSVWVYRLLPTKYWLHLVWLLFVGLVAYPVAGVYGLLALLLIAVITWRREGLTLVQRIVPTVMALLLMLAIPPICYRQFYYQTNSDFIWWQALPLYPEAETFNAYYLPYLLLALFLLILAACYRLQWQPAFMQKAWKRTLLQLFVAVVTIGGCWDYWYKDEVFHIEMRMDALAGEGDWEGVLREMRSYNDEPTRMMVMYKNLALFKLGRAGSEMYNYRDGSRKLDASFEVRMTQLGGKRIYLEYGLPNYCYRWCLEDGVEFGWRAEYLKYLVRCSLLNQEWTVAQKYIDILKQTRYHRAWAERYEPLARQKSVAALQQDKHIGPILRIMQGDNVLGSDQALLELFLLNMQAYRRTNDPMVAELALLSAMQLKSIPSFWPAFFQYANLHQGQPMPRHFQEAAFLYGTLEHQVDISRMPFDQSVVTDYQELTQAARRCSGMSEEQMKESLYPRFGHTFYYNYFLMRGLKTY